jgi:exodeoxyribonuclease VII large subunit
MMSVTSLNTKIKSLLEATFMHIQVEGEVSSATYHTSGHLYFSIKDQNSTIKCVMWRSSVAKMKFRLEKGMHIIIDGSISVYTPRGEYQFQAISIEPFGQGALALAFEQLKKKLQSKGYFDSNLKKPLPKIPRSIALVTAKDSAALHDMLKIIQKRWQLLDVYVVDTLVQGEEAPKMIAKALSYADSLGVDIVVLSRGGGSIEDLWSFNTEVVADAIYAMHTPVVSAIGHEVDTLISDFVADLRAPTPSAAMEMILPDYSEILRSLDELQDRYMDTMDSIISTKESSLKHIYEILQSKSPLNRLQMLTLEIKNLKKEYNRNILQKIEQKSFELPTLKNALNQQINIYIAKLENELKYLNQRFISTNPSQNFKKGYAQVIKDNKVSSLDCINLDEIFVLEDITTKMSVKVVEKKKI